MTWYTGQIQARGFYEKKWRIETVYPLRKGQISLILLQIETKRLSNFHLVCIILFYYLIFKPLLNQIFPRKQTKKGSKENRWMEGRRRDQQERNGTDLEWINDQMNGPSRLYCE